MPVTIRVGETDFQLIEDVSQMTSLEDEGGMVLAKSETSVASLRAFLAGRTVTNMVDVGIHRGGSVAFFAELLNPKRLAAIDINPSAPMLDDWIDRHGRRGTVEAFYEVDQADAGRLRKIHAEFFAGAPLDLVDDDASHELDRTRATFNTLFPLMRDGGAYVIEDWAWFEQTREFTALRPPRFQDQPSLLTLITEIMTASARTRNLIADILVDPAFVAVRKGPLALDATFDIRTYA